MIDLKAKREANKKRLLGIEEDDSKAVLPYTANDILDDAEKCWDIISIICRKKMTPVKGKDGETSSRKSKEPAFPELVKEEIVGERATTKQAKADTVTRTNFKTMEEMRDMRNAMTRHYQDDTSEKYIEYFSSVIEIIDGYAMQVVADIASNDGEFLDKLNKIRGCK